MSDIFISYASEDRPGAEKIARALEAQGWSVWWDRVIPAGRRFPEVIQEEIDRARCMVVLWSEISVKKDWVIEEASEGRDRRILVPLLIEQVQPPRGFRLVQAADLTHWTGDLSASSFRSLCLDISALIGPASKPAVEKPLPAQPVHNFVTEWWQAVPKLQGRRWVLGVPLLAALVAVPWMYKVSVRDRAVPVVKQPLVRAAPQPSGAQTNLKDGLIYVWIAPGEFRMGALPGDSDAGPEEQPRHRVRITKGFWLGETPVTVAAYKRFVKERPAIKMPDAPSFNPDWTNDDHPMVRVTWDEAQAYCTWAAGGPGVRLPSEAQWEYAARGGKSGLKYPWGNEITRGNANYQGSRWKGTSAVRSYPPNEWGLYDMAGNVWEWVADWYDKDYYAIQPSDKPADDPRGPDHGTGDRGLRGGSFLRGPSYLRVSDRGERTPAARDHSIGFRCVMDVVLHRR